MTRTRPHDGKAVGAGAFTPRRIEPSSSDDDESRLSDSDPEVGSDGDGDGCSSEDELGHSKHEEWCLPPGFSDYI